ncbi:MAG: tagaturonate epimerase family protein [Bellilinea sp.]
MAHNLKIYSNSIHTGRLAASELTVFLARDAESGDRVLGVRGSADAARLPFTQPLFSQDGDQFFAPNPENAVILRKIFSWLIPAPMNTEKGGAAVPSFGFGDRLGLATPGHIKALRAVASAGEIYPIFAQQSVRENARTGRTPQQVMDDALWAVFQEGWQQPWGGDADHLKQVSDLPAFVQAGYTFFTVDPGEHVDSAADTDELQILIGKISAQPWGEVGEKSIRQDELVDRYLAFCASVGWPCDQIAVQQGALRAFTKYGQAVIHITKMYRALQVLKPEGFDFEVSVDETETPTSLLEHFYIASELKRLGVKFNSLAPRFPGRFEKGVDYMGDLAALEPELARHAEVMRHFGGYRLSLHSGSDKFSIYPLLVHHAGRSVHVKTAGTSYLEALRVVATLEPGLFRQALELARRRYGTDRLTYHVSADESRLPDPHTLTDHALPGLLDDFDVRQALHVTFGSALADFGGELKTMLKTHSEDYDRALLEHFIRHLEPLVEND